MVSIFLFAESFDKLPESEDFQLSAAQAKHVVDRAFKQNVRRCLQRKASQRPNLKKPL